jgi:glutamate--cysteine ligase
MSLRLSHIELLEYLRGSFVPEDKRRVGLEWEKEAVSSDGCRLPFDGEHGIESLLYGLSQDFGWQQEHEQGRLIALSRDAESITLEPGGQVEYATPPRRRLVDIEIDVRRHLGELQTVTDTWDAHLLETGFTPIQDCESIAVIPKGRYRIMDSYLRPRGQLAHEMMRGSTSVQVSFDYHSAQDCAQKLEATLGLTPVVTALLANSPLSKGRANDSLSYRTRCWQQTDPDRTGLLTLLKEGEYSFEAYLRWALSVPMMFMHREGQLVEAKGLTFGQWMEEGADGCWPGMDDFELHLTSLFPEVRLKKYIELRGADNGSLDHIMATAALWKGLLYDRFALGDARELEGELRAGQTSSDEQLLDIALRDGLRGQFGGRSLQVWAAELVDIAAEGLMHQSPDGPAELAYLAPLQELVDTGLCPAEGVLARWERLEDPSQALADISYPPLADIPAISPEAGAFSPEIVDGSVQTE